MRCVASITALSLNRHMLVNERTLLVDVAFEADGIAIRLCVQLPDRCGAVYVVAVVALHQAFIDSMMVRF